MSRIRQRDPEAITVVSKWCWLSLARHRGNRHAGGAARLDEVERVFSDAGCRKAQCDCTVRGYFIVSVGDAHSKDVVENIDGRLSAVRVTAEVVCG
jgi:hypothetical protein